MDECFEVVGMTADDSSGDVYFLTRATNGTILLYAVNQDVRLPYYIASRSNFPP